MSDEPIATISVQRPSGIMTDPAIAVVIPLYNREASIAATIASVLDQRFGNFELIVVDDESSDGSAAVVERISDPRLRLIRQHGRLGGNAARNLGVRSSRAPVISFLDSDDRFYPTKLERVHSLFERRADVDAVIDSHRLVYGDGRAPRLRINPELEGRAAMLEALFRRRLWKATPGISVRRAAALKAGLFDEHLKRRQDYEFLIRLIQVANVVSVSDIGWEKTRADDSLTSDFEQFVPTAIDFWARHTNFHQDPHFRRGFAADVTGHWLKELRRGRFGQLRRERDLLSERARDFPLGGLVASGLVELLRLRRDRRNVQANAGSMGRNGGTGP